MTGRITRPWDFISPLNRKYKVVLISDIDASITKDFIKEKVNPFEPTFFHFFGNKALIQFPSEKHAKQYISEFKPNDFGSFSSVNLSPIGTIIHDNINKSDAIPSKVICLRIEKLHISLGIYDIYDECSHFGVVEKIICFSKENVNRDNFSKEQKKFALVQMSTIEEASLACANLSNCPRHNPHFQMIVQYSTNQDITIKFDNSKSFDFTQSGAHGQFEQLRKSCGTQIFLFTPDRQPEIFELWRPVPNLGASIGNNVMVTGFDEQNNYLHQKLFNLFSQYGTVNRVKRKRNGQYAIVQMSNQFYARLAMVHLDQCPFFSGTLSCSPVANLEHDSAFISKDFTKTARSRGDLQIGDLKEIWKPSETIMIKKCDAQDINTTDAEVIHGVNCLRFLSVNDAVSFLVRRPFPENDEVVLKFVNPGICN